MDPNDIDKFKRPKPRVYHRTKDDKVELIGRDGYRAGGGAAWGPGIYTVYDLTSTTKMNTYNDGATKEITYGPVIMENEVLSLRNFLIFNYDISKRVYKEKYTVEDQLRNILPEKAFKRHEVVIKEASNKCLELIKANPKNKYTARVFDSIFNIKEIIHHLRGVIFTGENDGNVLISYDRENLVPVRYSKDDGKTWTKITKQGAYLKAKKNLKMLMSKGDTTSLAALVEDHINNELSRRYGVSDAKEYVESKKISNIDVDAIIPFSYIFNLDESEYPNISAVKDKIKAIYFPAIEAMFEKIKNGETDFESAYKTIVSNQLSNFREILTKVYPEKVTELDKVVINCLKRIKEYFSDTTDEADLTTIFEIKSTFDYMQSENKDIEALISDIKEIIPNTIKKSSVTLDLVTDLAKLVDNFNKTFQDFFSIEIYDSKPPTPLKGDDVAKLVEMSKDIELKLAAVIEKNQKFDNSYGSIRIPRYDYRDGNGVLTSNYSAYAESVYAGPNMLFLSDGVIRRLDKLGYSSDKVDSSSGPLNSFFSKFSVIYNGADSIAKKYLDTKFKENIELLANSDVKDDFIRWVSYESFTNLVKIKIMLSENIKVNIKEEKLKSETLTWILQDDNKFNDINSVLFKNTLVLINDSGIRLGVEDAKSYYGYILEMSPKVRMLSKAGIIDRDVLLITGLIDLYGEDPKGFLTDEEKKEAEEKLQDNTFAKNFLTIAESYTNMSFSKDKFGNILSKLPINLSMIIDQNLLSKYQLADVIESKIKNMIKNKSFEKLAAFIDFLIEKKITKKSEYNISESDIFHDDMKVTDIPTDILMKIMENRVFDINHYGDDGYKNDEMAIALSKKGIMNIGLAESDKAKEIISLNILEKENIDYEDLKDIPMEKIDIKANVAKILHFFSFMKEDPDNVFVGAYIFVSPIISNPNLFDEKIGKDKISKMMEFLDKHFSEMSSLEELDMFTEKEMIDYQKKNPGFNIKNLLSFLERIKSYFKSEKSIKLIDKFVSKHSSQPVAESRIFRFEGFLKSRGK
jgi:hypothetical protein